jgi:hypothetical protein
MRFYISATDVPGELRRRRGCGGLYGNRRGNLCTRGTSGLRSATLPPIDRGRCASHEKLVIVGDDAFLDGRLRVVVGGAEGSVAILLLC